MSDAVLRQIQEIIQRDVNNRGLARELKENLIAACRGDFVQACHTLAEPGKKSVAIVTGFYVRAKKTGATWEPSSWRWGPETDGPLGAVFLAGALARIGCKVVLASEELCHDMLWVALLEAGLSEEEAGLIEFPSLKDIAEFWAGDPCFNLFSSSKPPITHLIAVERPGPSHTVASVQSQAVAAPEALQHFVESVPEKHWDRYHSMKRRIITRQMYPAHRLFEEAPRQQPPITTIGIGDGGNEIGMGKIPWEVIAKNIPNGGLIACRVPTDYNIVCGVSNWGAYGLAAGVWHLRGMPYDPELFSPERERELWEKVLRQAVLVDGVTGQRTLTVDGLSWDDYIRPLAEIGDILKSANP